jgi:hypothetical protein
VSFRFASYRDVPRRVASLTRPVQPLFNKLAPLPSGELRERVEKLAGRLGFPLKHLYVIDGSKRSSHSNAYVQDSQDSHFALIASSWMSRMSGRARERPVSLTPPRSDTFTVSRGASTL